MKKRKISATLSLILGSLLLAFLAFTHVVGAGYVGGLSAFVTESLESLKMLFAPDFALGIFDHIIGFVIGVGALSIALIFAIVWVVRLAIHRRKWGNYLSPLLFLIAMFVGVYLISGQVIVEKAFGAPATQVASAYWFVLGIAAVVVALHLLAIGLASAGPVKVESMLNKLDEELLEEVVEEEVVEEAAPAVAEVVEEEVVQDVEEEVVEDVEEVKPEPVPPAELNLDDEKLDALIRKLANEEIDKRPVPQKEVIVREVREVVVEKAKPAPAPAPVVEAKPVVKKAPVVVAAPVAAKAKKIERIPFPKRMQMVEDQAKINYNDLKSYLLSYGLNSRVSNVADSFRQGRVLFAKLTNSGNSGLKLFLPIKPEDYDDSKIPLKSAEGLKQYEDVPTFIYLRSDLSMKRAKQLIDDIMIKHSIARKNDAVLTDHVKELV